MICGIDEAGRGPIIGPLVICGLAVEKDDLLRQLGVRDSKKLSKRRREELCPKIEKVASGIEIVEISASEIDALRQEMTMNQLEAKIFASIIHKLAPSVAYVDAADVDAERFGQDILQELDFKVNIISQHKADETYPVVSAASILAKVRRDERVAEIEQAIGEPIGSGYASDPTTVAFIESWLERNGSLPPHVRKSWDTTSRLMRLKSIKRIDQFADEDGHD
ncbi:MAG: ribonuclease HII [Thermoplasmata archaeon]